MVRAVPFRIRHPTPSSVEPYAEPELEPEPEPEIELDDSLTPHTRLRNLSTHRAAPITSPAMPRSQTDLAHHVENGRIVDEIVTLNPRTTRRIYTDPASTTRTTVGQSPPPTPAPAPQPPPTPTFNVGTHVTGQQRRPVDGGPAVLCMVCFDTHCKCPPAGSSRASRGAAVLCPWCFDIPCSC
jgi:hypothetical protein